MSYILDALRKSDRQRQIGAVPRVHTLQDHYAAEPVVRNPWIAVAVIAILVNIGVGGWFWWQHQQASGSSEPLSATATAPVQQTGSRQAAAPTHHPANASQMPHAVPSPAARQLPTSPPLPKQPLPATTTAEELEQVVVFESIPTPPPRAASAAQRYNDLVDISELPSNLQLAMLALKINVHVYDPKPSQRFVLIDMKRYAEGHALPQGPVIEAITPDGVVLAYQGKRFLLKRN